MNFTVKPLTAKKAEELAAVYELSYCTLSRKYKTPSEMALYTPDYFKGRVATFLKDKDSHVFLLQGGRDVIGFARFSPIPRTYCQRGKQMVWDEESGILDGTPYRWNRKVYFNPSIILDKNATLLNQIYLHPTYQHQGLGSFLVKQSLHQLRSTYNEVIVEYNKNNSVGKKFYQSLGFVPIAQTQDLDHILQTNDGLLYCISPIEMAFATTARICQSEKTHVRHHCPLPIARGKQNVHD